MEQVEFYVGAVDFTGAHYSKQQTKPCQQSQLEARHFEGALSKVELQQTSNWRFEEEHTNSDQDPQNER